VYLVTSLL